MLFALAWRNIWRQPVRTALSLTSIALAAAITVFLLSLQRGAYGTMKENVLRLMDGFAQIQPAGYVNDPDLHKTIADPGPLIAQLRRIPAVTAATPRAETYAILSNGPRSYGAAVVGVDPAMETRVTTLGSTIAQGHALSGLDADEAIVGAGLARNLKLSPGSRLTSLGEARDGTVAADVLTVAGLFATGSPDLDREVIEIPLGRFQSDFAMEGRVNVIAIGGAHLGDIGGALPALASVARAHGLVVRDWTALEPALNDIILLDASFSLLIYVSLVVIAVFIILNTLLMSVLERTHEFGMLMAIGMRPAAIGRMVWIELILLSAIGAICGIAIGSAIAGWTAAHGIPFPSAEALFSEWHMPSTLYPELDALSALAGPLAIVVSVLLAGVVPYVRVLRLKPVSAMASS